MNEAPSPDLSLDGAYQQHLQNIARYCESQVEAALEEERSIPSLSRAVHHLYEVVDHELLQLCEKRGSAFGPHSVPLPDLTATAAEAIVAVEFLRNTLGAAALESLAQRLFARETESCPFCTGTHCLIRTVLPILSRGFETPEDTLPFLEQDALLHAIEYGLRLGLRFEHLDCDPFHFAPTVLYLLQNPAAANGFLQGCAFPDELRAPLPGDRISKYSVAEGATHSHKVHGRESEATGYIKVIEERSMAEYYDLGLKQGLFHEALQTLKLGTAAQEIAKIIVPRVYNNQEEIPEWREHFIRALRAFREKDWEDEEAFNALSSHRSGSLAYQGMNDRAIMEEHGAALASYTNRAFPEFSEPFGKRSPGKARVGYLSANMHGSNGCRWSLGWLNRHAPDIETYALNVGTVEDQVSRQFRLSADHYFHLVRSIPDNARFIRGLDLDFLIFTDIGLHGFNTSYATMRLARTQATAWGHPVTSGFPNIDLYLSSDLMEPVDGQDQYTEQLVRLPNSGLCYSPIESFPSRDRAYFGLPADGPLIVNVQTKPKLLPQYDHLYRDIAAKAGAPIVFLEGIQPCDTIVTKRRMEEAGVPVHWLPHLKRPDFLALLQLADVSLDPPLWSGGNTTIEALTLGTPVVTLPGPTMRSRHSYAFAKIAGAPDLIAENELDYVNLACDSDRLQNAIASADFSLLFNDLRPVEALDELILSSMSR
jgi:predicted O-linked N-acetylglucosamine transferase (SPINDLY family)